MLDNLVIVIAGIVLIVASVFAWWIENGPEKKNRNENEMEEGADK